MRVLDLTETPEGVLIPVKVVPGASRDRIAGVLDGALKITVSAPPERGRANRAVLALLTRALRVRRRQLTLVGGETMSRKVVAVRDLSVEAVRNLLG